MTKKRIQLVVIVIVLELMGLGFKFNQGRKIKQKLQHQQQKLSSLQQVVKYRTKQLNKLDYNLQAINRTQPELLNGLERIVNKLNLQLINLAPRANQQHNQAVEWPVKIVVTGKYQAVVEFFQRLNQLDWIIEVRTIKVTTKNKKLVVDLKLSVYTDLKRG